MNRGLPAKAHPETSRTDRAAFRARPCSSELTNHSAEERSRFVVLRAVLLGNLLANDFYEDPLAPAPVEFAIENSLPRAEVEFPVGDGHDNLAAHDLPFEVGISVVLAGPVVVIMADGLMRRQLLEPDIIIAQ